MKEITSILQPRTLPRVLRALHGRPSPPGVALLDAHAQGRGRGAHRSIRLTADNSRFRLKPVLLVTCADTHARAIALAPPSAPRTGKKGAGLVTTKEGVRVIRIHRGKTAVSAP